MTSNDKLPSDQTGIDATESDFKASEIGATDTGAANVNAVYPGSPDGPTEVTDADVADMNADSSTQGGGEDAVPGVRSG